MSRGPLFRRLAIVLSGLLLAAMASAQPPLPTAPPTRAQREDEAAATRRLLDAPVDFRGFDDPDTKVGEALDYLQRAYNISIDVNARAFRNAGIEDILTKPLGKELPKMRNVSLSTVLRKTLERASPDCETTWVVRNGTIEVTTLRAYRAEFYPDRTAGPFPPLVSSTFEKVPLEEALKRLSEENDANLVLDIRESEKAKAPVTARFSNVPLDTAVLLLADMAGLKPVEMDGVYYVTSRQNAKTLREEQAKAHPMPPKPSKEKEKPAAAGSQRPPQDAKEREEQLRRLKATVEGKQPPK